MKRLVAVKTDPSSSPIHVEIEGAVGEDEARWAAYAWVFQSLKDYTKMEDPPDVSELYRRTQVIDLESVSKVEIEREGPLAKFGELMRKKGKLLVRVQSCHTRDAGTFCGYCDADLARIEEVNKEIDAAGGERAGLDALRRWVEERRSSE